MTIGQGMAMELQYEGAQTRKVLERVPEEKYAYTPHQKSMNMGQLASHIVESVGWGGFICQTEHFEFDPESWKPWVAANNSELLARFDDELKAAIGAIQSASDEDLFKNWKMTDTKGTVFIDMPRVQTLRAMVLNHLVHHRAQLLVYLRINDVPLPAVYGPSADEQP